MKRSKINPRKKCKRKGAQETVGESKDTVEKEFVSYPDIAEDVINVLLYDGEKVADAKTLLSGPTETIYQGMERLRSQFEDLCKYEMLDGRVNLMYLIANQSRADGKILLRKIGYIGGFYREQYENKMPNLFPIIEIVLYWGKDKWRGNHDSRHLFKRRKISENTWKYIDDIKVHLFEMRHLPEEVRKLFKSDMRIVVDFLAEGESYYSERKIVHKAALIKMIKVLSGEKLEDGEVEKWLEERQIKEEDEVIVCELFDQYERKGRAEGLSQGIIKARIEDILELLKDLGTIPGKIQERIFREEDVEVLKRWHKAASKANSIEEFLNVM